MTALTAQLRFDMPDEPTARAVADALRPELDDGPEGTKATLTLDGHAVCLAVEAEDLSGMRAAITGAVRLLDAAQRLLAQP